MPTAALIVGICSLVAAIAGGAIGIGHYVAAIVLLALGLIGGIVGIVLSAQTIKKVPEKKGMGVGGLITSIIAVIYSVISLIACIACIALGTAAIKGAGEAIQNEYNNMTPEEKAQLSQELDEATKELNNELDKALSEGQQATNTTNQ